MMFLGGGGKSQMQAYRDAIVALMLRWVTPQPANLSVERMSRWIWTAALIFAVASVGAMAVLDLRFASSKVAVLLVALPLLGAVMVRVRRKSGLLHVPTMLESILQMLYAIYFAILTSFLLATLAAPYVDEALVRADALLGFDWRSHAQFVQEQPSLRRSLLWAYNSHYWQWPLAVVILALRGAVGRLQIFVLSYVLTLVICVAISGAVPARSAGVFFGLLDPSLSPVSSGVPRSFAVLESLRQGAVRDVLSIDPDGIVTFPSFHAASAVMLAYAFWGLPLLRWPMLVLNFVMLAATPAIGSHYLIDVIAGCVIAVLVLTCAGAIGRRVRQP